MLVVSFLQAWWFWLLQQPSPLSVLLRKVLLEQDDCCPMVKQWLGRVIVTILLAVAWHYKVYYWSAARTPAMTGTTQTITEAAAASRTSTSTSTTSTSTQTYPCSFWSNHNHNDTSTSTSTSTATREDDRVHVVAASCINAQTYPTAATVPPQNDDNHNHNSIILTDAAGFVAVATARDVETHSTTRTTVLDADVPRIVDDDDTVHDVVVNPPAADEPVSESWRRSSRSITHNNTHNNTHHNNHTRVMHATVDKHPGLDAFYHWYNVETSLYRIYELGRTDDTPVVCPFLPKSERGHVSIHLRVTNQLLLPIEVFWVDYRGTEASRGVIPPGGVWHQTTWIGHPWTFRIKADPQSGGLHHHHHGGDVLLHYIPYRVIPTTRQVPTVSQDDFTVGMHQFSILPFIPGTPYMCRVVDPVMPHPPQYSLETPIQAARWTLQHMERTDYYAHFMTEPAPLLLLKYLTNIVTHPDVTKYRCIRTAQPKFASSVWNTAARGLLLACGFVEHLGRVELGTEERLCRERVSDVSLLLMTLEQWKRYQQEQSNETGGGTAPLQQPEGVDGFGRANFGRAGAMSGR